MNKVKLHFSDDLKKLQLRMLGNTKVSTELLCSALILQALFVCRQGGLTPHDGAVVIKTQADKFAKAMIEIPFEETEP